MKYNVIVETKKATADFKRECNRLQKIIDGNVRGQYTTTNGGPMSRLLIVSNRLSVSVAKRSDGVVFRPGAGGLTKGAVKG